MAPPNAIVLTDVTKSFRRTTLKREYTTLKTEVVRILKGQRKVVEPATTIDALKGVSFTVPQGATVGIVGRNGSGKSTLLKLITGIYTPTSGTVEVKGRISALLELGAGFHPDFTGRENILINGIILGMSRAEVKARTEAIIAFAELGDFIDEPVRTYSSGMFMRLAFAVATHVDPELLIVDEILSVGDEHFQRKSSAKMEEFRKAGKTILLVTHGLGTVEQWCDYAVWIDGGKTRLFGDPRMVVNEYRRAVQLAEEQAETTGVSALSTPGAALPELASAVATVKLEGLSVRYEQGCLRLEVKSVAARTGEGKLRVDVASAAGQILFSVERKVQWQGAQTWQCTTGPIPLAGGQWRVTLEAQQGDGASGVQTESLLVSEAKPGFGGLIQPGVEWGDLHTSSS
jgi:lipopolysaccharide transport system ATP-binding protein